MRVLMLIATTLFLAGCNEYTSSVCQQAGVQPIAGFEGTYAGQGWFKDPKHIVPMGELVVQRRGVAGQYTVHVQIPDPKGTRSQQYSYAASTCVVAGQSLVELRALNNPPSSTYMLVRVDWSKDAKVWDYLAFDPKKVDAAGLPVRARRKLDQGLELLVVDNRTVRNDLFLSTLISMRKEAIIYLDYHRK